jgi:hypothetical protein
LRHEALGLGSNIEPWRYRDCIGAMIDTAMMNAHKHLSAARRQAAHRYC